MKRIFLISALLLCGYGCGSQPVTESNDIIQVITDACDVFDVPVKWGLALAYSEQSGFKNNNVACSHNRTAYGTMGVLYRTAKEDLGFTGPEYELNDYTVSIPLAISYLSKLLKIYKGDMQKAISHYKTGKPNNKELYCRVVKIICDMEGL